MNQIILATHGGLADGMRDTLSMVLGDASNVHVVSLARDDKDPITSKVQALIDSFDPADKVYVCTDMLGSSVNITAYGIDANGEDATIRDVSFNYNKDHYWFASGHQAEVTANTLSLYINPEDATPGTSLNIDIRTEDGAQMATATVILRVMDSYEFERLLSQLPPAEEVTLDNYDAVLQAVQQLDALVLTLPEADQADAQTIINHYYYVLGRFSE